MSCFLVLAERQLLRIDAKPTQETLEKVLAGPVTRLAVNMPGAVSVYCNAESMAKRIDPNALATIFCHKRGAVGMGEAVFGSVAITCDDDHATSEGAPRWVLEDLVAMLPAATELADAGGVRMFS